ncbi:flagellar motor switch protein FliG [Planktomarina sp.]|nr:flagellar motor switch protein FliG [Planktomarina sp.]MDB4841824.1 flagellar motor switch protein FliG [Planktomarina sp.]
MAEELLDADKLAELSGTEKSAILMMLLGEEEAAQVLQNLTPREVQHLGTAMYSVAGVDQNTVNMVLDEFLETIKKQTGLGLGAGRYIENVMIRALGEDKAQSVLGRITPAILDWMDARAISELIIDEHPQIKALIISYLDFGLGADVLTLLPDEIQADIVRRIATIETVEPGAVKELERVMKEKFAANTSLRASKIGGVKAAAKIMNFTKTEMETRILTSIKKEDKDLMAEIQDNMFVFENLSSSDDRSLQTLLRSVDQDVLIIAMKGAETALQDKLLGCMSTRAAANIRDEMEALGPVRLTEVQEAQKQIINVARKLSDDGTIVLAGRGGEEMV